MTLNKKRVARGMGNDPKQEESLAAAYHHLVDHVEKIVTILSTYDEDYNPFNHSTLTQCALRFSLAPSAVTAVIPSISKPQHIDDCLGALRNWIEYEGDVGFGHHPLELDTLDDIVFAKDEND